MSIVRSEKIEKRLQFGQAKDPTVIDEPLIRKSLREKGEQNSNFTEIKMLTLSYESKLAMSHLTIFSD